MKYLTILDFYRNHIRNNNSRTEERFQSNLSSKAMKLNQRIRKEKFFRAEIILLFLKEISVPMINLHTIFVPH